MEREDLWFEDRDGLDSPRPLTIFQLADALRHDDDVRAVADLYADRHLGKQDVPLSTVLAAVVEPEHVPYLSALRYKESGLRKRAQWEKVWEEQREEDKDGERRDIKVPPKYTSADFLKHSYWSNRGKLDVPKERFISYPGASPDNDPSLLIGWAGWNHRHQAEALVNLLNDRLNDDGWHKEDSRFVPLLAGLAEVMPWVKQWHDEYDEEWEATRPRTSTAPSSPACTAATSPGTTSPPGAPRRSGAGRASSPADSGQARGGTLHPRPLGRVRLRSATLRRHPHVAADRGQRHAR